MRNYLNKNHDFRYKKIEPKLQALIVDQFENVTKPTLIVETLRFCTALFNIQNVKSAKNFFPATREDSYMWSTVEGSGYWDKVGSLTTKDYVYKSAKTIFSSLSGSYCWDWDSQNNLLRSSLASDGWTLNCAAADIPYNLVHKMGLGETIGYCWRATVNETENYYSLWPGKHINISLLGDPTLRMHVVCPVNSLHSAITADNNVMLAWKPADDSIIGYYVYKLDTLTNKYNRITPSPVNDTWFEDTLHVAGNNYYMVKTFKLSEVASGSYYNLSQGIFDTFNYVQQTPVPVSNIDLSINPQNVLPLKIYDPFKIDAEVSPANATNKLLKWSVENITGNGKFDLNGEILTDKPGAIAILAEALDGSGITGRLEADTDSIPDAAGPITGDTSVCRDYSSKLYSVPEIRGATSYIWTLPSGVTDTSTINEIEYVIISSPSGNIKVRGHNPYADGDESILYVTVNEIPPKPEITLEGNILHSNASSGNQWYFNSKIIEGATDSIYTPTQEGRYYVEVTLNNCTSPISNLIKFSPTIIDVTDFTSETVIYPNPSAGQFTISFGTIPIRQATVKVFSLHGKLVYSETFQNRAEASIDLTAFTKGIYILNVITDKTIYYGKVCLE